MLTASEARALHVNHDCGHTKNRIERLIQIAAANSRSVTLTLSPPEVLYFQQYLTNLGYTVEAQGERLCVRW